jgi:glucosamine--fructose-6-phosphate aminotransferase (isomerizing)
MCGIICYVGTKSAKSILMEGLKRLEYRGYDSAGLAVQNGNEISCYREVGKIVSLEQLVNGKSLEGYSGIAHTRWATHGEPSVINAHPQRDQKDNVYVIHNGIIENYHILKKQLEKQGLPFVPKPTQRFWPS